MANYTIQNAAKDLFAKIYNVEGEVTTEIIQQKYPSYTEKTSWSNLMQSLITDVKVEIPSKVETTPPASITDKAEKIRKSLDIIKDSHPVNWSGNFGVASDGSIETKIFMDDTLIAYIGFSEREHKYYVMKPDYKTEYSPVLKYCISKAIQGIEPTIFSKTDVKQYLLKSLKDFTEYDVLLTHTVEETMIYIDIYLNGCMDVGSLVYRPSTNEWQGMTQDDRTECYSAYMVAVEKLVGKLIETKKI